MMQGQKTLLPGLFNRDFTGTLFRFPMASDCEDLCKSETHQGLNIYEENDQFVIEAALPGLEDNEIDVNINKGVLWIKGEKKEAESDKNKKYYRKAYNSFSYSVALPDQIEDREEPEASYESGVLKVAFHKVKDKAARRIHIKKG